MDYLKIYNRIITKAKFENRIKGSGIYYEAHHIVPKCLGGDGRVTQWKTHTNIVLLTGREHFLCHRLLHEIYPDNSKLFYAFSMMCNASNYRQKGRYTPNSKTFEYLKTINSKFEGKCHTEEFKIKVGLIHKNKIVSEKTRELIRSQHIGLKYSKEVNLKKGKKDEFHVLARAVKNIEDNMEFKTLKEASIYYNVSRVSIYNWIKKGKIVSL